MNNDTFDRFYNEFKDWSKEDILKRTYNIILDDADKTRQIEQLENIRKEAIEYIKARSFDEVSVGMFDNDFNCKENLLNILNKGGISKYECKRNV